MRTNESETEQFVRKMRTNRSAKEITHQTGKQEREKRAILQTNHRATAYVCESAVTKEEENGGIDSSVAIPKKELRSKSHRESLVRAWSAPQHSSNRKTQERR